MDLEDAVEKVIASGQKNFVLGPCDNVSEDGTCEGHPVAGGESPRRLKKAKSTV